MSKKLQADHDESDAQPPETIRDSDHETKVRDIRAKGDTRGRESRLKRYAVEPAGRAMYLIEVLMEITIN